MINKKIIHINELDEKAYNHLGINLKSYLTRYVDIDNRKNEEDKDKEKEKLNIVSKIYSNDEAKSLGLNKKYPYEEIFFTESLNEKIDNLNNKKDEDEIKKELKEETKKEIKDLEEYTYINIQNKDVLVDEINIEAKENEVKNIFIELNGDSKEKELIELYRDLKINVYSDNGNINIIYVIKNSNTFSLDNIYLEAKNQGVINFKYIILGETKGNFRNISRVFEDSKVLVSGIYFLSKNSSLDFMYEGILEEERAHSEFIFDGILLGNSTKTSKDILRFKNGAKGSIGIEKENILMLSNDASSKTAPILLSEEEDIVGEHGYSLEALNRDKIFYLESRGLTKDEANTLIILSKLGKVFGDLKDNIFEKQYKEITQYIKKEMK